MCILCDYSLRTGWVLAVECVYRLDSVPEWLLYQEELPLLWRLLHFGGVPHPAKRKGPLNNLGKRKWEHYLFLAGFAFMAMNLAL